MEDSLDFCRDLGREPDKSFSGKMQCPPPPQAHRLVATAAKAAGKSLNAFAAEALGHQARAVLG